MSILALLTRDHFKLAQESLLAGDKSRAAEEYIKAGDHQRAAKLAAELGDGPALIRSCLLGVLGELPPGFETLNAHQVGELAVAHGHPHKAILLFELARDYRRAASCAVKLHQTVRAAQLFEKAQAWADAAFYYEQNDLYRDALRVLQEEARELVEESSSHGRPARLVRLDDVNLKRAEILLRLGKVTAAVTLLGDLPSSVESARLFERAGKHGEALAAYLDAGRPEDAVRLARISPDASRLEAMIRLRSGRPAEAGDLFAKAGLARESAEAYEAAEKWAMAAYRWEAAEEPARAAEDYLRADRSLDAARCYAAAGQPDDAAATYATAGDLGAAAEIHVKAGKPQAAVTLLLSAGEAVQAKKILAQLPPGHPEMSEMTLAVVPMLLDIGLAVDALAALRRLPVDEVRNRLTPAALDRLYWEGRALEALGQGKAAQALYRQVARLRPTHRDAAYRLSHPQRPAVPPPVAASPPSQPLPSPPPAVEVQPIPAEEERDITVGSRLAGRYDLLGELGRGGMGRVFKALDLELGDLVAVKVLMESPDLLRQQERTLREVQICRRISHPNVVRVFDLGRFAGRVFITMELLEGQSLAALIAHRELLSFERIRELLAATAAGLREAHAQGIIHRDLKPANLFATPRGLKILDFGIAHRSGDSRLTQAGFVFGSPHYMAPEQLLGQPVDSRSDLYSLGVVAYELISGQPPFDDPNPAILALAHLRDPVPDIRRLRPDIPDEWLGFLARLLAKQPADRFQSAQEILDALARLPAAPADAADALLVTARAA